jgi:hypothetical protein
MTIRSSLLAPPTTVDDDSEEGYQQDENHRPEWKSQTMDRPVSPPIEHVIKSFNEELENMTKSFDDLLSSQQQQRIPSIETTTPYSRPQSRSQSQYSSCSTAKKPPRVTDPPPSADRVSPLRNNGNSTPSRRKPPLSSYTPAEPPPPPVETPVLFPTPNRRRRDDTSTSSRYTSSRRPSTPQDLQFSLAPPPDWEEALHKMRQLTKEQDKLIETLERENDRLRMQLDQRSNYPPEQTKEQDRLLIETLERDNDKLRRRLDQRSNYLPEPSPPPPPPRTERVYREDVAAADQYLAGPYREDFAAARRDEQPGSAPRRRTDRFLHREEPNGRVHVPASTSSTYRTTPLSTPVRNSNSNPNSNPNSNLRSPPRRIHTTIPSQMRIPEEGFTPGTRFVSQLAYLMKMEQGHHAPLSVILDRHWDHLKYNFQDEANR